MIDIRQFRDFVVRPTLGDLALGGLAAERLVLGTALVESGLVYLHQIGAGPALGFFQCEPATHDDIWNSYLFYNQELMARVKGTMSREPSLGQLMTNMSYMTAICRVHYRRAPFELGDPADPNWMADAHKRYYNTALGATDVSQSIHKFQQAIDVGP